MESVHSWDAEFWLMTLRFGWKQHPWPPQPSTEKMPKIHKIVDFWWFIPHWETRIGHFVANKIMLSKFLMIWGCWGHWGHWGHWGCWGHWGLWGSWCQGNNSICKGTFIRWLCLQQALKKHFSTNIFRVKCYLAWNLAVFNFKFLPPFL